MKRIAAATWLLSLFVLAAPALAASSPEGVISRMTEQVLAEADQAGGSTDPTKVRQVVESVIAPNLDFHAMTARAVGPSWRSASDAQKGQLVDGFKTLLVRTYSGAFGQAVGARYKVQRVVSLDAQTSEVRTAVSAAGSAEPLAIVYRMQLKEDDWKVVDVSVAGVWLVPNYRSQFAPVLQNGDLDTLIRSLQSKTAIR